ncbi:hypothetical protein H9P43_003832 [Blastocladiella emersonii ATCC 22665]|nr:hypothetical protein H9P43_003832 [Blastocladiella emersonii ATCC 22665]
MMAKAISSPDFASHHPHHHVALRETASASSASGFFSGFRLRRLLIDIVEARDLPRTEYLSKEDPYVVITAGAERHRTLAKKEAGTSPRFDFQVDTQVDAHVDHLLVEVFDSNKWLADDLMGRAEFPIAPLRRGERTDTWISLKDAKGRSAGKLRVIFHPMQVRWAACGSMVWE